jgi:hypothetical protein
VYRAEIRALEEREDRLFDSFDGGETNRATYDTESDTAYLDNARDVLELAKQAKSFTAAANPKCPAIMSASRLPSGAATEVERSALR